MSVNEEGYVVCDRCNQIDEYGTKWDKKKPKHICDKCVHEIINLRVMRSRNENKRLKEECREAVGKNVWVKGDARKVVSSVPKPGCIV